MKRLIAKRNDKKENTLLLNITNLTYMPHNEINNLYQPDVNMSQF